MSATISLEVHGLCIVKEAGPGDSLSTVLSVNPMLDSNFQNNRDIVPPLKTHLIFSRQALKATSSGLPPFAIAGPDYSRIDGTMFSMELPPSTTVELANPDFGVSPAWMINPPATFGDLNLGALPAAWGIGPFQTSEGPRLLLPKNGTSGWGDPLGTYVFAAQPGLQRAVADLYFWSAFYSNTCRISIKDAAGAISGFVDLEGTADVRFACYCRRDIDPFNGGRSAFDFHKFLGPICGGTILNSPHLVSALPFHVGSGSCPPIKP